MTPEEIKQIEHDYFSNPEFSKKVHTEEQNIRLNRLDQPLLYQIARELALFGEVKLFRDPHGNIRVKYPGFKITE